MGLSTYGPSAQNVYSKTIPSVDNFTSGRCGPILINIHYNNLYINMSYVNELQIYLNSTIVNHFGAILY